MCKRELLAHKSYDSMNCLDDPNFLSKCQVYLIKKKITNGTGGA
jgi:hypothetical protein